MGLRATELTLARLGTNIASHANESLRSLQVLRAIEDTISALTYDRKFYKEFAEVAEGFAKNVKGGNPVKILDPNGDLEATLARAQQAAKDLYESLITRRSLAEEDPEVNDEDELVDEFTRTISVLADLHNKINDLRWAVGEHDADLEKPGSKHLKNAAEIEDALKSL